MSLPWRDNSASNNRNGAPRRGVRKEQETVSLMRSQEQSNPKQMKVNGVLLVWSMFNVPILCDFHAGRD